MSEPRTLAQTLGGENVVITVDAGEDPFIRVWRYDRRLDTLSGPVPLGSFMARLGAYLEEVDFDPVAEQALLVRVAELLREAGEYVSDGEQDDAGIEIMLVMLVEEARRRRRAMTPDDEP